MGGVCVWRGLGVTVDRDTSESFKFHAVRGGPATAEPGESRRGCARPECAGAIHAGAIRTSGFDQRLYLPVTGSSDRGSFGSAVPWLRPWRRRRAPSGRRPRMDLASEGGGRERWQAWRGASKGRAGRRPRVARAGQAGVGGRMRAQRGQWRRVVGGLCESSP